MSNWKLRFALASALIGATALAHAQYIRPSYSYPGESPAAGGSEIGTSGFFFTPYLGTALGHDDNLFLSPSNQRASNLYIISPGFKVDGRRPGLVFQSTYQYQLGRYTSSREDDYTDQAWHNSLDTAFDQRTFLRLGYDYIRGHDPRGSTDRPIASRPDVYKLSTPNATFAYGAPGAQGRVELYYSDAYRDYLNNHETTQFSDRQTKEGGAAFYWRVGPKTYALVEARQTRIEYDIENPLSAKEDRAFVGVTWDATAATTGTLKVGRLRRDFEGSLQDDTSTAWEGLVTWLPRTYSRFDFYTSRQTNESTGLGNYILSSIAGVTWTHDWTSVLMTGVTLRYQKDGYRGFDRTDNTTNLGLKVGYKFRPWLTLGAEYNYWKRDSNLDQFDYDRNLYLLTATMAM